MMLIETHLLHRRFTNDFGDGVRTKNQIWSFTVEMATIQIIDDSSILIYIYLYICILAPTI